MKLPEGIREDFAREPLARASLLPDPVLQFECWLAETSAEDPAAPNACSLATVASNGQPSVRTVLLKLYDHKGFVFFTNYASRKAQELAENPCASMLFPWIRLGRQVIISGEVRRIPAAESLKYFVTRSRGSQLGAWASSQSNVISSRTLLETKLAEMKHKFAQGDVPLPSFWGGYRLVPETFEFWQGQHDRLHDRFLYRRNHHDQWQIERLAP